MKSSLFKRLLFSYLAVIVITTGIIGAVFARWVRNFVMDNAAEKMINRANAIRNLTEKFFQGEVDERMLAAVVDIISSSSGDRMIIVDSMGRIVLFSNGPFYKRQPKRNQKRLKVWRGMCLPDEDLEILQRGEVLREERKNPYSDQSVMLVGIPVMEDGGTKFAGAVVVVTPITEITTTFNRMLITFLWIVAATMLLSTLIGLYLSRSISAPLRQMSDTAIAMAGGDFSRRVQIDTKDEIGRLADSINFMAEELSKLEQMRRDYVANVSHELRTPLTSIQGYIEPLMDGTVEDEQTRKRYYEIIHRETLRLSRLIKDLMELSGLESGNIKIELEPVCVSGIIENVVSQFKPIAKEKGIDLTGEVPGDLPLVLGNEDRLHQVLTIFVDNALKFTPASGKVQIKAWEERDEVCISVTDTGAGIPEKDLPYIWDRFYKVDKSRRKNKGTGLGLSIARQIIALHGGRWSVKSKVGEGSTFTFTLKKAMPS